MTFKSRFLEEKDWEIVEKLQREIFPQEGKWTQEELKNLCSQGLGIVSVDLLTQKVEGFIFLQIVLDEAEILSFGVKKEKRGQGRGQEMLETAKKILRQRKIRKIFLDVSEASPLASYLYKKNGFYSVGIRKKYYKSIDNKFFDAIVMLCNL